MFELSIHQEYYVVASRIFLCVSFMHFSELDDCPQALFTSSSCAAVQCKHYTAAEHYCEVQNAVLLCAMWTFVYLMSILPCSHTSVGASFPWSPD